MPTPTTLFLIYLFWLCQVFAASWTFLVAATGYPSGGYSSAGAVQQGRAPSGGAWASSSQWPLLGCEAQAHIGLVAPRHWDRRTRDRTWSPALVGGFLTTELPEKRYHLLNIVLQILDRAIRGKVKVIQLRKEEAKLSLFANKKRLHIYITLKTCSNYRAKK